MPLATREEQRAYQRNWVARRRAEFLAGKTCAYCGAVDDLHVHHLDPAEKVHHAIWSWSEERRIAELAKCEVLCRPCHEAYHGLERQQHGTRRRYQAGCRCTPCCDSKAVENRRYRARRREREAA